MSSVSPFLRNIHSFLTASWSLLVTILSKTCSLLIVAPVRDKAFPSIHHYLFKSCLLSFKVRYKSKELYVTPYSVSMDKLTSEWCVQVWSCELRTSKRLDLLTEVQRLQESLGVSGDVAYTCETAGHFFLYQVLARWEIFLATVKPANNKVSKLSTCPGVSKEELIINPFNPISSESRPWITMLLYVFWFGGPIKQCNWRCQPQ